MQSGFRWFPSRANGFRSCTVSRWGSRGSLWILWTFSREQNYVRAKGSFNKTHTSCGNVVGHSDKKRCRRQGETQADARDMPQDSTSAPSAAFLMPPWAEAKVTSQLGSMAEAAANPKVDLNKRLVTGGFAGLRRFPHPGLVFHLPFLCMFNVIEGPDMEKVNASKVLTIKDHLSALALLLSLRCTCLRRIPPTP